MPGVYSKSRDGCGGRARAASGLFVVLRVRAAAELLGNKRSPLEDCVGSFCWRSLMVLISTKQLHLPSPSILVPIMFYRQETQAHGDVRTELRVGATVSSVGVERCFSSAVPGDRCTFSF